jgi:outer membrane protein OmpA-like peptidoglycan-associated protein
MGALLLCAGNALAQSQGDDVRKTVVESTDKYEVKTNRFWSNWFISAGAGPQIFLGDFDRETSFGKRISPALDIAVGKWFTPGIGMRIAYNGLSMKGATKKTPENDITHAVGDPFEGRNGGEVYAQKFNFANLHADAMFNLSQLLCGYNEKRVWSFIPYLGVGWMWTWQQPRTHEVSANVGILNSFRVCPAIDINLEVRGSLVQDRFDGEIGGRHEEGLVAVTAGLTYRFPKRGWGRGETVVVNYNEDELREMRDRLSAMGAENERLKNALVSANNKKPAETVKTTKEILTSTYMVTFPIGKSKLSNEGRVNLGFQAEAMKKANAIFVIRGYADESTGSAKRNDHLSQARAQAVYDCLTKEFGVPASQLKMEGEGGVPNLFYQDPEMSRVVITQLASEPDIAKTRNK